MHAREEAAMLAGLVRALLPLIALLGTGLMAACGQAENTRPTEDGRQAGRHAPRVLRDAEGVILVESGKRGPCPCELGEPCDCKGHHDDRDHAKAGACKQGGDKSPCDGKDQPVCVCDKGRAGEAVWCRSCGVGYVDRAQVSSKSDYLQALANEKADAYRTRRGRSADDPPESAR